MTIRINDVHSINIIARIAGIQFVPILHHCIAQYNEEDKIMAGVLFTDWRGASVQMHEAVFQNKGGIRPLIWLAFHYAFVQLGVKKVFGLTPESNIAARNFALHLGFKVEYLTKDVFIDPPDANGMYLLSMYKEDCRWLHMKKPNIEIETVRVSRVDAPPLLVDNWQGETFH